MIFNAQDMLALASAGLATRPAVKQKPAPVIVQVPLVMPIQVLDKTAPSPHLYGIPHDSYRTGQYPTIRFIVENEARATVVEQPTGSGKSAVACAMSSQAAFDTEEQLRVVVVVRTKNLQKQYGDLYGASLMKGKSNYPCVHPKAESWQQADECLYAEQGMYLCPHSTSCPYMDARYHAMHDPFVCTNYAYWLSARQLKMDVARPCTDHDDGMRVLICDEAHMLSDITLGWSGTTLHKYHQDKYDLPDFPILSGVSRQTSVMDQLFNSDVPPPKSNLDIAYDWLGKASYRVGQALKELLKFAPFDDPEQRKEAKMIEYFLNKIEGTMKAIAHSDDDWYVKSGPGVVYYRGEQLAGMVIKPLTARHQFDRLFLGADRSLLMSATIGDPGTFAEELGLEDYIFRTVPNQFPAASRQIRVLDAPRLNYRSTEADYNQQADVIAEAIKSVDPTWSGLIHVTRKNEAPLLANRLARRGLGNRVWVPPLQKGRRWLDTTAQLAEWEARRKRVPNSLMICWQFKEGFNGRDERICISGKVPFPSTASEYEKARRRYNQAYYNQRAALALAQELGRTRRGRIEDYDLDGQVNGLVAIADGNWRQVQKYIPRDVREAIV